MSDHLTLGFYVKFWKPEQSYLFLIFNIRKHRSRRYVHGRATATGTARLFLEHNAKMHESEQKFNVRKCKTMRLDESY